MSQVIHSHVLRVGQSVCVPSQEGTQRLPTPCSYYSTDAWAEPGAVRCAAAPLPTRGLQGGHPTPQEPSLQWEDVGTEPNTHLGSPILDISIENLNRMILELDPSFQPLSCQPRKDVAVPTARGNTAGTPQHDVEAADIKYIEMTPTRAKCTEALQGSPSPFSRSPQSSGLLSHPAAPRGHCTNGSVVFSSPAWPDSPRSAPPGCAVSESIAMPLPRAGQSVSPRASPGADQLLKPLQAVRAQQRGSEVSLLSMSPGSDTSYVFGRSPLGRAAHLEVRDGHLEVLVQAHHEQGPSHPAAAGPGAGRVPGAGQHVVPRLLRAGHEGSRRSRRREQRPRPALPHRVLGQRGAPAGRQRGAVLRESACLRVPARHHPAGTALRAAHPHPRSGGWRGQPRLRPRPHAVPAEEICRVQRAVPGHGEHGDAGGSPGCAEGHVLHPGVGSAAHTHPRPPESVGAGRHADRRAEEVGAQGREICSSLLCSTPRVPQQSCAAARDGLALCSQHCTVLQSAVFQQCWGAAVGLSVGPGPQNPRGAPCPDAVPPPHRVFFRRHYPLTAVRFCGMDPEGRKWQKYCKSSRIFGFVAKSQTDSENLCHLFAEYDPVQSAALIIDLITKLLPAP